MTDYAFTVKGVDGLGREAFRSINLTVFDTQPLTSLIMEDNPVAYFRHAEEEESGVMVNEVGPDGVYSPGIELQQPPLYFSGPPSVLTRLGRRGEATNVLPASLTAMTLMTVFKPNALTGYRGLVCADPGFQRKWQWRLNGDTIEFVRIAGGVVTLAGPALTVDETCIIGVSLSATGECKFYKNGAKTHTGDAGAADYGGDTIVQIGYMSGGGGASADAYFSESVIFPSVISEERMAEYAASAPPP